MTDKKQKQKRANKMRRESRVAEGTSGEFLWTAKEIAAFLNRTERFVYQHQKALGLRRIDGTLAGLKSQLTALFSGEAV